MTQSENSPIIDRIESLVEEEQRLWHEESEGRLDDDGRQRLAIIRAELDRCWDHLRRRRANPDAPDLIDPVPDPPNDLDGPDPEPPHLEHGVHGADEPAPDPDVPRDIP
ncbi:MAG: DUF2630 family protein [Thermoleophilaceae bacterium]